MPPTPDWNKYINAGAEFVALTRSQARKRASELVSQGQLAENQVQTFVDDLVEESRRRTDEMLDVVRVEIQKQVKTLGIATKEDLAKLEARLTGKPYKSKSPKLAADKKATPKSGRRSGAKSGAKSGSKAPANMSASAKKTAKKSSAKKTGAKKAAKSSAKKAGAKKAAKSSAKQSGAAKKAAS